MKIGNNLTDGPMFKKYIYFIIPIILSGYMQQLYNTADTAVVGMFAGDTALAAVGCTGSLINLIINLFLGLAIGTNVVCARFYGAGDRQGLQNTIHTSILISVIFGVFLTAVGIAFSRPLLSMMGTTAEIIEEATLYMKIYFIGAPASMIYNFGSAILRAAGDTKRPLYILMISGLVNVLLNLFCVIVLHLGVAGVAIGTIASQIVSAVIVLFLLSRAKDEFRFSFPKLRIHKKEMIKITAIGIPSGLNGAMFSSSNVIIQSAINSFGKVAVAGAAAANNIEAYGWWILNAVEQGAVSFAGQNMGAKRFDRVKKIARIALLTGVVGALSFCIAMYKYGPTLLGLFADDASRAGVVEMGMVRLMICTISYVLFTPFQVMAGVLKGMGKVAACTIVSAIFVCLFRVVWVFAVFPFNPTLEMLYISYPVSWSISSVVMTFVYIYVRNHVFKKLA
jgi:putative MATE family efflux protein